MRSLETVLPYPWNAPSQLQIEPNSPAEAFSRAFAEAQEIISNRTRLGPTWPLYELFKDKSTEPMRAVDEFLVPILQAAVTKHKAARALGLVQQPEDIQVTDEETLLDHLIQYTDGMY